MSSYSDNSLVSTAGVFYPGVLRDLKKSKAPFQPLFEAFINALEAIRDRPERAIPGEIKVKLFFRATLADPEFDYISIEDNGIGFNEENFERFLTFKDYRKGPANKGSGRIQLIQFFDSCEYSSSYSDQSGLVKTRTFSFSKKHADRDPHALVFYRSTVNSDNGHLGTTLILKGISKEEVAAYRLLTVDELKDKLVRHFLLDFCLHRNTLPIIKLQHFVDDNLEHEETIQASDIPAFDKEETVPIFYSRVDPETNTIVASTKWEDFTLRSFKIDKSKLERNEIKLTSKNEIVEDIKIAMDCLSPEEQIENNRYLFLLSGSYVEQKENDVRGEMDIPTRAEFLKAEENGLIRTEEILLDDIRETVNEKILGLYQEIQTKVEEHKRDINELKKMFLLDAENIDEKIGLNDTDESILAKVYKRESENVAKRDAAIKKRIDELDQLSPSDADYDKHLEEAVTDLVKSIPESNRTALTRYVARRRLVLELFQKILRRQLAKQGVGNRNDDEKLLHNLIFQQTSDRPDQSDLWLFNEEFVYYSGSSNTQLQNLKYKGEKIMESPLSVEKEEYRKSLGEDRLQKRPDILLFPNEGKCIIIEFKNPNENVSDHLNQINKYASWLRNLTKDKFAVNTFFGYLIGQNIEPRDVRSADADFKHSEHFDYLFRPAKTVAGYFERADGSIYTEVLKYSTLLERASARNKIFLEKLGVIAEHKSASA